MHRLFFILAVLAMALAQFAMSHASDTSRGPNDGHHYHHTNLGCLGGEHHKDKECRHQTCSIRSAAKTLSKLRVDQETRARRQRLLLHTERLAILCCTSRQRAMLSVSSHLNQYQFCFRRRACAFRIFHVRDHGSVQLTA